MDRCDSATDSVTSDKRFKRSTYYAENILGNKKIFPKALYPIDKYHVSQIYCCTQVKNYVMNVIIFLRA